jgi:TolB-like protein
VDPSADEIRCQLDRVLASGVFANADRMSGFLRYVVDRALAGEGDQVKEYVVGVAVFGRPEAYDPRLDSIVRVEARRLRAKLDEFYAGDGRHDSIVIQIPRGSYAPTFERRAVAAAATAQLASTRNASPQAERHHWRPGFVALIVAGLLALPVGVAIWQTGLWTSVGRATPIVTIAVLPFTEYSSGTADELLAARLTDGVTSELARVRTLGVVSSTSAQQFVGTRRPLREIAQALNAELILEASVSTEGDGVRVSARLVDATIDRKVWVGDIVGRLSDPRDLARRIAAAVGPAAEQTRNR